MFADLSRFIGFVLLFFLRHQRDLRRDGIAVWLASRQPPRPQGVKRENENGAGGETVFKEASIGVRLSQDSLVVIPAIF